MSHISALKWFEYEAKSLSPTQWLQLKWHLWRCPVCQEQASRRVALNQETVPARNPSHWIRPLSFAAIAVVLAVVSTQIFAPPPSDDLREKGTSRFVIFQVGSRNALAGGECRAGEVLQGEVFSKKRFGLVVLVSASGAPQVLFPPGGRQSARLTQGRHSMPNSWVLDEAPGTERFIAMLSDEPLNASEATAKVLRNESISGVEVVEQTCVKSRAVDGDR